MKYDNFKGVFIGILLLGANIKFNIRYLNYLGIVILLISIFSTFYPLINKRIKFRNAALETIDTMKGIEFEEYSAFLLLQSGFDKVKVTQQCGDQGIDVIAIKDATKYGIQCKRWKKNVGNKAIQEVYAGTGYYKLDKAIVLTNSYFTLSAKELAKQLDVELWDRDKLIELLENYRLLQKKST